MSWWHNNEEYLNRWLAEYAQANISPRSFERYSYIVKRYLIPVIGNVPLTQLRPEHLQKQYTTWLNKGLSTRTVRYHHAVIHKALHTALKWGQVSRNVADGVDIPRVQREEMQNQAKEIITDFQQVSLAGTPAEFLLAQLGYEGVRPLTKLMDDYNWVTITKGWLSIAPDWLSRLLSGA